MPIDWSKYETVSASRVYTDGQTDVESIELPHNTGTEPFIARSMLKMLWVLNQNVATIAKVLVDRSRAGW